MAEACETSPKRPSPKENRHQHRSPSQEPQSPEEGRRTQHRALTCEPRGFVTIFTIFTIFTIIIFIITIIAIVHLGLILTLIVATITSNVH